MTGLNYFDWLDRLCMRDLEQHWGELAERHPEISYDALVREMHVRLPDGSLRKGFFAFRSLLWRLPLFWPLALVLHVPFSASIGPRVYSFVASRRARLQPCEDGTCAMHTGVVQQRPVTESREQPTVG